MRTYLIILIFFFYFTSIQAQDLIFSQFYAAPLQLNPAFAGNTYRPFVTVNYRNQWASFSSTARQAYESYAISYSQFSEKLNSSFGLFFLGDDSGDGIYKTTNISGIYAYRFKIRDNLFLKWGIQGAYVQNKLDWNKLVFPDQISAFNGSEFLTEEQRPDNLTNSYFDVSTGILVYGSTLYGGFSIHHLNTPNESFILINDNLLEGVPTRYTFHAGAEISLQKDNNPKKRAFVSPNILLSKQGESGQLNGGAYFKYGMFIAGTWYRLGFKNPDAAIFLLGFEKGILKFGMTYDWTVAELSGETGGSYEASIIINFDKNKIRHPNYNDCFGMFR